MTSDQPSDNISIAADQGALGFTIYMFFESAGGLTRIRHIFERLKESPGTCIQLLEQAGVSSSTVRRLTLRSGRKWWHAKSFIKKAEGEYEWSLNPDEWYHVLGLVDGLAELPLSGHQYLTREGRDDALVVLEFRLPKKSDA